MKVLKFGGSSVGSVPNLLNVKQIVESINDQVIVVVSALGGVTDKLIETSHLAAAGDASYLTGITDIVNRHIEMVYTIIPISKRREILIKRLNELFNELEHIYNQVYESHQLSAEKSATIVSYGERLSSLIVSCLIKGSSWFDSCNFIKTEKKHHKYNLDSELTARLVKENLCNRPKISLVPGFISTDKHTGEITNLGRGGSDYTASIIASALDADCLEIWTDVDGFMTADPRVISTARPINELSYEEAIELCNYGAKVIYPPTINPVCHKEIPIIIKNTMHPEAPGTVIKRVAHQLSNSIKGISSIKNTCLISIEDDNMLANDEIQQLIVHNFVQNEIDMFWLIKPNCRSSINIGIHPEDEASACKILRQIFNRRKIERNNLGGSIPQEDTNPIKVEHNLSMITVVGENIQQAPYNIDNLFNKLTKNDVDIVASTGKSGNNLSFIIDSAYLSKAMHIAHEHFFQEENPMYSSAS